MLSNKHIQRILVIRFSSLGDIILLTPLFRAIRMLFPNAQIDFLTSTDFAGICANNPHIHKIIPFDRRKKGTFKQTVQQFRDNPYDLVFDAHRSLRSRLLLLVWLGLSLFFTKKTFKINKRSWQRNLLLLFKWNFLKDFPTQRGAYCQMLEPFADPKTLDQSTEIFPSEQDQQQIENLAKEHQIQFQSTIAIGPSSSFVGKSWPKEYYLELIQKLVLKGHEIIILGGASDEEPKWLVQHSKSPIINLAGKLSFLGSSALLQKCDIAISNDSAIGHFAESVGTPAICIFGPTSKEFGYGPFMEQSKLVSADLPCRPCSRNGKGKCTNKIQRECLTSIQVDDIFQLTMEVLENKKS
ncbi:MAG: ADP-heptose:LPS heptosyltransferase [bacterium]|jgi:ADP-heptose:LPS heptosyltransferase